MKDGTTDPYPGENACAAEFIALADEYFAAALGLFQNGRRRQPLSRAPARLCSIHAIELYLNAFLMHSGDSPKEIRGHNHKLTAISERAVEHGLILRNGTTKHLIRMTETREYLISRYGPEMTSTHSEITRVIATLEDVAKKVKLQVAV